MTQERDCSAPRGLARADTPCLTHLIGQFPPSDPYPVPRRAAPKRPELADIRSLSIQVQGVGYT